MALTALEQRLVERVRAARPSIERDLDAWVAIPTGWNHAPGLDELRAILRTRLEAIGGRAELLPGAKDDEWGEAVAIPPTLVVRGVGNEKGASASNPGTGSLSGVEGAARPAGKAPRAKPLLFSGHLDTVFDPRGEFRVLTRQGDRATGPGASDMKGGLAILVAALEALHALGALPPWTVVLNSDEERGSFHSANHLRELAREHSVGFVMEPALPDGGLVVERLGSGQLEIRATGRAAHAGRDFSSGISAVDALAGAILDASRVSDPGNGRIVNIGVISGGEAANIVPAKATATGTVRFRDRVAADAIAAALRALARGGPHGGRGHEGAADAVAGGNANADLPRIEVRLALNRPAKPRTKALDPFLEICLGAARDLGRPLTTGSTGGSSDGNILEDAGLPTLDSLGVRGGNLHRTDEFVELSTLGDRAALLAITIHRAARHLGLE